MSYKLLNPLVGCKLHNTNQNVWPGQYFLIEKIENIEVLESIDGLAKLTYLIGTFCAKADDTRIKPGSLELFNTLDSEFIEFYEDAKTQNPNEQGDKSSRIITKL